MQALAKVNKVKDILLEARTTESDGGFEELGSNTGVKANSMCDFVDVGTSSFTDGRECVDGGNSLGEHSVCSQLGKFRRPEADGQDTVLTRRGKCEWLVAQIKRVRTEPSWRKHH